MPQSRTTCPRCHQPVMAEINQLFDTTTDSLAKQKILSGQFNVIQCPTCGYQGMVATPIVYHDGEKELLLSFFPPELGLPMNEQEKLIGPLLNQVMNALPVEKRKGYLLRPQTMLSMQHMMERILEGDGITKEMIQDQQKKVDLIRRLMEAAPESREKIIEDEAALIDETFFALFSRLLESAGGQDQSAMQELASIQQLLLEKTKIGQEIKAQSEEAQAAMHDLQEASKAGLTREKLVDLIVTAPTDVRVESLVRMARSGMDYNFFQILSTKIDAAAGEEKDRLTKLRDTVLKLTAEIDLEMQEQVGRIQEVIGKIIQSPDIEKTTEQVLPAVNELFIDVLQKMMDAARQKSDLELIGKYQQIVNVIQKASTPPPEYELLEKLLSAESEELVQKIMDENPQLMTPELTQLISSLITQAESTKEDPKVVEQLRMIYRVALRASMKANLSK